MGSCYSGDHIAGDQNMFMEETITSVIPTKWPFLNYLRLDGHSQALFGCQCLGVLLRIFTEKLHIHGECMIIERWAPDHTSVLGVYTYDLR